VEAAAHERRAVRRGQPGRPRLRARAPRARRARVGEAQRSGLRGHGVAPRDRSGAAAMPSPLLATRTAPDGTAPRGGGHVA
jgi:hypothetical protein